jgi:hypothetical protein
LLAGISQKLGCCCCRRGLQLYITGATSFGHEGGLRRALEIGNVQAAADGTDAHLHGHIHRLKETHVMRGSGMNLQWCRG